MGAQEEGLPGKPCFLAQVRDARCGRGSGLGAGEPEQPAGIGGAALRLLGSLWVVTRVPGGSTVTST